MSSTGEPVAVVGLGAVFPGAADVDAFWRNIVEGVDAITVLPPERGDPELFDFGCRRGGFVAGDGLWFDPGRFGVMPAAVTDADPDQMLALTVASTALDDVGARNELDTERVGVILGRGGYLTSGGAQFVQRVRTAHQLLVCLRDLLPEVSEADLVGVKDAFVEQLGPLRPEGAVGVMPNLAASRIANRLDLGGPAYVVDAACASTLVAVDAALRELRTGRCDLVLAGGVHHCDDLVLWAGFDKLGALSPSGAIRPFSRHADGILIGEGTGILALELLDAAERRGHRVYGVIRGSGIASDGRAASMVSPDVGGQVRALERAYAAAGVGPETVTLVEGHGTGTPTGDRAELETLRRVYGPPGNGAGPGVGVLGSVKSMIGHAMPAAGAAGLIKAVLAVHHQVLPPTLHAEEPHPALADTRFRLLDRAEPWEPDQRSWRPRRAGVNGFGFGGINAHVIVEEHRPSPPPSGGNHARDDARARPQNGVAVDVIRLAGENAADLARQLSTLDAPTRREERMHASRGTARVAIVDPNPKRIELARRVLEKGNPWRGLNDVWFEPAGLVTAGGRVAFLFPGVEPSFEADLGPVAECLARELRPVPPGSSPLEAQGHQILAAGRLLHDVLGDLGVRPDLIAGHSMGEWTGWYAGELIPRDQADEYLDRLRPGFLEVPRVVYLALGCGAKRAAELTEGIPDVAVSHDNCPHQSVVCGSLAAVDRVKARVAEQRGLVGQELPFRSGFHSPALRPYLERLRPLWESMPVRVPRVPLWSATTAAPYPDDPAAVRDLAAEHLVQPVRFRELTEHLYQQGVRVFVQPGVGSLTGFVDDTLKDRPHLAVAAHTAKRSGLDQLVRVAAALWVEGVDVDLTPLAGPPMARTATVTNPSASTSRATPPRTSAADASSPVRAGGEKRGHSSREARPVASTSEADPGKGPLVRLSLGTPLVRLPSEVRLPVAASGSYLPSGTDRCHQSPLPPAVAAAHEALLKETIEAGQDVAKGTDATLAGRADQRIGPAAARGPASVRRGLRVDMDTFPWLEDHCIIEQAAGWSDFSDGFPVVPLTALVELLAGAARDVAPGMVVTGVEDIRATRFVTAAPPTDAVVQATREGADRVHVAIEGFARATVQLGAAHPPAPGPSARPLTNPRPSPRTAEQLYGERWMFHGPRFHGVRRVGPLGDEGIDGVVEVLPTPGATLDSAAQLYGWWVLVTHPLNFFVLPQSVERIELFGPLDVGRYLDTTVRVTEETERMLRADLELSCDGRVLVRITGSVVRRFNSDGHSWAMSRDPGNRMLASAAPEGFVVVDERWRDSASRELMAHRYLNAAERAVYRQLKPLNQRHWLLGRIAAKDAVRHALWATGPGPVYPAEITVGNDERGRPFVAEAPGAGTQLALSISHTSWVGTALARPLTAGGTAWSGIGIDIEAVEPRSPAAVEAMLTPAERALLPVRPVDPGGPTGPANSNHEDLDTWLTRAWAAKEAAAKAAGTGLGGRPGDFPIRDVTEDHRLLVGDRWVATTVRATPVQTVPGASTDTFSPDPAPPNVSADDPKELVIAWTD